MSYPSTAKVTVESETFEQAEKRATKHFDEFYGSPNWEFVNVYAYAFEVVGTMTGDTGLVGLWTATFEARLADWTAKSSNAEEARA
jgi:hypothetical protein